MTIRIGGGQGFYGDGHAPARRPARRRHRLPGVRGAGRADPRHPPEGPPARRVARLHPRPAAVRRRRRVPYLLDGRTRFITNAGGINPIAAGRAVVGALRAARRLGPHGGDGRGRRHPPARRRARTCPTTRCSPTPTSGRGPIVEALDAGAHIVICGRVADASLFLAPLVHEFGWAWDDWDRLAAGVTLGHLLECSGQVTGGNYSGDWWNNADPLRVGFPIGECEPDGTLRRDQAGRHRRPGHVRHRPRAAPVRGARPVGVPEPRRHRRLRRGPARRPRRRPGAGDRRPRRAAARDLQGPGVHAGRLVGRGAHGVLRGPTPRRRRGPRCAFLRGRAEAIGMAVEEWSRGVLRRERVRRPDGRAPTSTTIRPR